MTFTMQVDLGSKAHVWITLGILATKYDKNFMDFLAFGNGASLQGPVNGQKNFA